MQVKCEKKLKTEIKDSRKIADQEMADALGTQIVVDERKETRAEKRRRIVELEKYVMSGRRSEAEIDDYIKEFRENDRF